MLKKLLIGSYALLCSFAVANAGNVLITTLADDFSATGSKIVVDSNGAPLAVGTGYIARGVFSMSDADISAAGAAGNFAAIIGDFTLFGAAGKVPDFAGIVTHDATSPLADGDAFVGKTAYAVISKGTDTLSPNQDLLVVKTPVVFAADNPVFAATMDLRNPSADQIIVGTGGGTINYPDLGGDVGTLRMASGGGVEPVIPEPSTALLLLSGLGGMIFIRRRR